MQKSILTKIALALAIMCSAQQTVHASAPAVATTSFRDFVKGSIQYTAGGIALGGLGYGAYELTQAIKHWIQTNNDNPNDIHIDQRNASLLRMLAAFGIATTAGVICYADINKVSVDLGVIIAAAIKTLAKR